MGLRHPPDETTKLIEVMGAALVALKEMLPSLLLIFPLAVLTRRSVGGA
jgi:hypothetical protein